MSKSKKMNRKKARNNLAILFSYLKPYKWLLVVVIFSVFMAALLNVFNIALLQPVLEIFFGEVNEVSVETGSAAAASGFAVAQENGAGDKEETFREWIRGIEALQPAVKFYDSAKVRAKEIKA